MSKTTTKCWIVALFVALFASHIFYFHGEKEFSSQ